MVDWLLLISLLTLARSRHNCAQA